jgi:hypothetical protein
MFFASLVYSTDDEGDLVIMQVGSIRDQNVNVYVQRHTVLSHFFNFNSILIS